MADVLPLLDEIRTIARNGLTFADNPYDIERYERLMELASRWYGQALDLPPEEVRKRLAAELGYITPKVGTQAAIFDAEGRILLVLRADDRCWGLPGGWLEPNESPQEGAVREARVTGLIDVFSRPAGSYDYPHALVSVVYGCEVTGGHLQTSHETLDLQYWRVEEVTDWHGQHQIYAEVARAWWQRNHH
jgi:ADP-ribose pyrophosphatase YjhB (NUDIX family)